MDIDQWSQTLIRKPESPTNNVFYHMYCINDAVDRFIRTYKKIQLSGLINQIDNIYVNCVGYNKVKFAKNIQNMYKVVSSIGTYDKGEAETLDLLRDFCIKNTNGNVLYLHSKGVWRCKTNQSLVVRDEILKSKPRKVYISSKQLQLNIQTWVDCMEYFLIEKYNTCFEYLDKDYQTCGILFREDKHIKGQPSLYSGNFWWAKNSYIKDIKPCQRNNRWNAEYRFLCPNKSKYICLYDYKGPFYEQYHPRHLYTKEDPLVQ